MGAAARVQLRGMPEPAIRRILAPVELSDPQEPDMDYAIRVAGQLGAELVLFACIDTPAMVSMIGKHKAKDRGSESFDESIVEDAKAVLSKIVDAAAARGVRALGHATVSENVEEQILKEALVQKVDLILVRSKGRHGLMKALLGSTAGEILKAAPCPVLVARS
jgi:nucleotide-binding universal stress UspA family protein